MKRHIPQLLLGLTLGLLLTACGTEGVVDAGPVEPSSPGTTAPPDQGAADDQDQEPVPDADEPAPDEDEGTPDTDDGSTATTAVRLYYLAPGGDTPARSGPFLVSVQREIPSTPRIALATLRELVDGPTGDDQAMLDDLATAVPENTLVLDVAIDDGVATVNLSREFESGGGTFSMFGRLAQLVYTVTQFPTVDEVRLELDGSPVTVFSGEGVVLDGPVSREDYLDLLPTVFVDTPSAGADTQGRVRVTGMAQVFEATFQYRLEAADGTVLAEGFEMSDNGMGWGAFDFTLDVDVDRPQEGLLTVWEYSAKDGSVQAERVTPLALLP